MDYQLFLRLLQGGERDVVDFKIDSQAFATKTLKEKGELAKDICALANNGNRKSHLIIGVSDDRKHFKSFVNPKFTDDALQNFCKGAIHPPPRVVFSLASWKAAKGQHAAKTFGVMAIGPNPRTAFRLAQNYIDYPNELCFRKNEVWLRRGATSDLATPEEIVQLLRRTPTPSVTVEENFTYQRIPEHERELRVFMDLREFSEELGGSLSYSNIVLNLGKQRFLWQVVVTRELTASATIQAVIDRCRLAHGVLIISLGSISRAALPAYPDLCPKESWGYYIRLNLAHRYYERTTRWLRDGMRPLQPFSLPIVALANVKDSQGLRDKFLDALRFINEHPRELDELKASRVIVNRNLQTLLTYGWKEHIETTYGDSVRRLKKHEFVEGDDYRKEIYSAMWRKWEVDHAKRVLVSSGITPATLGGRVTSDTD